MIAMLHFATLVLTTLFAAAAAVAFNGLLLRAMFVLMRPATARRVNSPTQLCDWDDAAGACVRFASLSVRVNGRERASPSPTDR